MLPLQALPIVELFFGHQLEIRYRMNFYSIIGSSMRTKLPLSRRITLASAILSVLLLVLLMIAVVTGAWPHRYPSMEPSHFGMNNNGTTLSSAHHRRLLRQATKEVVEPNRIWGDKCSKSDIVINQGPTAPLPSGIPTYTVEIMNVCGNGCDIRDIHLSCGWFSSARLINPRVFKRLRYNDCLVNNGKPLINGGTISFQYANTFSYPLSVASVVC